VTISREEALKRIYNPSGTADLRESYDAWAREYDTDMAARGYKLPGFVTALVARHVAMGDGPILDAAAGTGQLGEWLNLAGYRNLAGNDLSEGMLKVAESRKVYGELKCEALGNRLDYPDGHFRAVASAGSFGVHHAPASAFKELVRITQPGGHLVITVRRIGMEKGNFPQEVERLEQAGLWQTLETHGPFFAFRDEPDSLYMAWVFQKTV